MSQEQPLSQHQKTRLKELEPKLHSAVQFGNFPLAKKITSQIQGLLRETGHETRLLQNKNWLYECALETGNYSFAERGYIGTRKKIAKTTRIYLEATALLAICYLRQNKIKKAKPLVAEALSRDKNIKSELKRKQFHSRFIVRLEEECILAGLYSATPPALPVEEAQQLAIEFVRKNNSEQEILIELGKALPKSSLHLADEVREVFDRGLPAPDRKALPPPISEETVEELGARSNSALKRVAWRALCDPDSDLHKEWTQGIQAFYDKKVLMTAIATACVGISLGPSAVILAAIAALAIRFGAAVFCEKYQPAGLMIERSDRE